MFAPLGNLSASVVSVSSMVRRPGRALRARRARLPRRRTPTPSAPPARSSGCTTARCRAYDTLRYGSLRLWDAGVTWPDIETSPGVYDWSRLDALVSAAQEHGVEVTLVLAMTPSFYGPAPTLPPTDLTAYADYVRAVMTRYRDFDGRRGIAAYEVVERGQRPDVLDRYAGAARPADPDRVADPPAGRPRRHARRPVVRGAARRPAASGSATTPPSGSAGSPCGATTTRPG